MIDLPEAAVVARLRAAGCVFAEDEAALLIDAAQSGPRTGATHRLEALTRRRVEGVPLEHLLGWVEFRGRRVGIAPGVFVPRRRTEFLAECAQVAAEDRATSGELRIVELCCGNGAVGLDLLARVPSARLWAVDLDPAATACAARNLATERAEVLCGDLYAPLPDGVRGRVDVLVANAPYVPTGEVELMPREAREFEARMALDGGPDGLDVLRRVIAQAPFWLGQHGVVLVETSERQAEALIAAAAAAGLEATVSESPDRGAVVLSAGRPSAGLPRALPPSAARTQ